MMAEPAGPRGMTLAEFAKLPPWAQRELMSHYHEGTWINADESFRYCSEILRLQDEIAKLKETPHD